MTALIRKGQLEAQNVNYNQILNSDHIELNEKLYMVPINIVTPKSLNFY